jgi:hypothetical protein
VDAVNSDKKPETLADFDALLGPLRRSYNEILARSLHNDQDRIAYYQDLAAAENALADLFLQGLQVVPLPACGNFDDSLMFYALETAAAAFHRDARETRRTLAEVLARVGEAGPR